MHEINRQGKIVYLDDLSIPAETIEVGFYFVFILFFYKSSNIFVFNLVMFLILMG